MLANVSGAAMLIIVSSDSDGARWVVEATSR